MKKFLIFIFLFIYIDTYIILPFDQLNQKLEYHINNNDITNITTENSILNLYTTIYMGNPPFKLLIKLFPYNNYFSFTPIPFTNFNYTNFTFYNPFLSKSLHRNKNIDFKEEFREVTDVFYFITNENDISDIYQSEKNSDIKQEKFKPYLYLNCFVSNWHFSDNYTGVLGLSRNYANYQEANFIKELQAKSVINNSIWSVEFNNNFNNDLKDKKDNIYKKGNLIIGEYPHIYNPKKYNEKNYYKIGLYYDNVNKNNNNEWIIKIYNTYIIKKGEVRTSSNYIKYINIIFGLYTMQAPYFLFEQLSALFFEKYFENKICQYEKYQKENDEKIYIFCSKNNFDIKEQNLFPKIVFNIKNSSNIIKFEFNSTDLFASKNDKVYFLISFSLHDRQDMIKVGQIFLYKYKIVFDYNNEEIGLYISSDFNQKGNKDILIYIIIIFIFVVFFGYKKGWWCVDLMKSRKIKKR
jgi:hypothetical protein